MSSDMQMQNCRARCGSPFGQGRLECSYNTINLMEQFLHEMFNYENMVDIFINNRENNPGHD